MDVRNSQDSNKEARMLAELIEILFPSAQQQQQQQEEVVMTDVADQIAPPPPPPPPQTMGVAVDVEEQQRRQQEELYMLTVRQSWEAQQELVYLQRKYWQYWRHLQQVNRFLSQNPQPSQLPANTAPNNKSSEKRKLVPGANIQAVDKWAWRKYGQKPIKGSTFPRSYYKCSTSKECKAKKQVEKVQADPDVYLVTYLGDHFHPNPVQLPGPVLASFLGPIPVPVDTLNNYHPLPPPPPLPHPLTFDQLQLPPPPHQLTLSQLPLNHQLNFEQLPPLLPPNQLSFDQFQQAEIPFQLEPPPPSEMGSVAAVEAAMEEEVEDEEGLLIPNSMVNEDVMRSIQELKHWKIKGGEPGSSSGFGSSGPGSSSGFRSSGPGFY